MNLSAEAGKATDVPKLLPYQDTDKLLMSLGLGFNTVHDLFTRDFPHPMGYIFTGPCGIEYNPSGPMRDQKRTAPEVPTTLHPASDLFFFRSKTR